LADELGLEPSAELRDLEQAILRQDPSLSTADRAPGPPAGTGNAMKTIRPGSVNDAMLVLSDGTRVALSGQRVVVGRDAKSDIVLSDPSTSRVHAEVRPCDLGHRVVDLESLNGTLVNGTKVSDRLLVDGDQIQLGSHRLRYESGPRPN
jgi:hypothetical protein